MFIFLSKYIFKYEKYIFTYRNIEEKENVQKVMKVVDFKVTQSKQLCKV